LSRYTAVSGVRDVHIMLIVNCRAQRRGSRIIPSSANIFTVRGHLTTLTSVQQSARRRLWRSVTRQLLSICLPPLVNSHGSTTALNKCRIILQVCRPCVSASALCLYFSDVGLLC